MEPDGISQTGGTANGSVNPNGSPATAWFEWGSDPRLIAYSETAPSSVGSGSVPVPVSHPFTGLPPGETIFYRVAAAGVGGTVRGSIDWFAPEPSDLSPIEVNSLSDGDPAPPGKMTLRRALSLVDPAGTVLFNPVCDGGAISLHVVGAVHTTLMGEVYEGMQYKGYSERDYGKSALYATHSVSIDAGALPKGVTIAWAGTREHARVLAVNGDLTMRNVTVSGGWSSAEPTGDPAQKYTLARGGGLAVWGYADLSECTVSGNRVSGEAEASRDRGAYGGGIYANGLEMADCIVSGNRAGGYGAAGGGIYSVGGADGGLSGWGNDCSLDRCAITGNRVTAQHAYGGGIFTLGGGPDYVAYMNLTNCTIARNLVEDNPALAQAPSGYYYRGGGLYMGGGAYLTLWACTIAQNAVSGYAFTFNNKPNMGGGGVGATVGNAHVVEDMEVLHSVMVGNTLNNAPNDLFTGSVTEFTSSGYNLIGKLDFSQILVPIPIWSYYGALSRKHFPKEGDRDGVAAGEALDLAGARLHPTVLSAGTDAGSSAVLWYPPAGESLHHVPDSGYFVPIVTGEYSGYGSSTDDFLNHVLDRVRNIYGDTLGADFGSGFGDMTGTTWYEEASTWPSMIENVPWIAFWRNLDLEIGGRLGTEGLADGFWGSWTSGPLDADLYLDTYVDWYGPCFLAGTDQLGNPRPSATYTAAGAVNSTPSVGFWSRW